MGAIGQTKRSLASTLKEHHPGNKTGNQTDVTKHLLEIYHTQLILVNQKSLQQQTSQGTVNKRNSFYPTASTPLCRRRIIHTTVCFQLLINVCIFFLIFYQIYLFFSTIF